MRERQLETVYISDYDEDMQEKFCIIKRLLGERKEVLEAIKGYKQKYIRDNRGVVKQYLEKKGYNPTGIGFFGGDKDRYYNEDNCHMVQVYMADYMEFSVTAGVHRRSFKVDVVCGVVGKYLDLEVIDGREGRLSFYTGESITGDYLDNEVAKLEQNLATQRSVLEECIGYKMRFVYQDVGSTSLEEVLVKILNETEI